MLLFLIGISHCAKLDKTYLPPNAASSGGTGDFLAAPDYRPGSGVIAAKSSSGFPSSSPSFGSTGGSAHSTSPFGSTGASFETFKASTPASTFNSGHGGLSGFGSSQTSGLGSHSSHARTGSAQSSFGQAGGVAHPSTSFNSGHGGSTGFGSSQTSGLGSHSSHSRTGSGQSSFGQAGGVSHPSNSFSSAHGGVTTLKFGGSQAATGGLGKQGSYSGSSGIGSSAAGGGSYHGSSYSSQGHSIERIPILKYSSDNQDGQYRYQ